MTSTTGEELGQSFLTMSKSNANDIYRQYIAQMEEVNNEQAVAHANVLSPISETDSNKYQTIDSKGQTIKRINPDEERKLTGTGSYKIEDEYENEYYSDDFESDEEDSSSSIFTDGCSGTTVDTSQTPQGNPVSKADQA